ncbi:MAG TPA: FAD-binding oxidoreductase [Chryseosolibacter sp.]|nr:FAD-binding oxidoreductase [Chryseosolibacter sp.]
MVTTMRSEKADVVVIGGGVFGCSIAYYYSRNNSEKKIIVLERSELCNAATSRAAALVTRIRAKKHFIPLSLETYRVIPEMERLLDESMGMKYVGVMHVAGSESRIEDLAGLMNVAAEFNQPAQYISAAEAGKMAPWLKADESMRIAFMPGEGYCDPYLLGTFYARCAKKLGADFRVGVNVSNLIMDENTAVGVETDQGKIHADAVIIASGAWAPILAIKANVGLPMAPVRSQYWITEKNNLFPENSPIVLLPDAQAYLRPESGSLLFGIREKKSFAVSPKEIPDDISQFCFSEDRGMKDLSEVIGKLARFFPKVYDTGLKSYIAGFSGYTPDNNLSMGAPQGINNLFMATGCVGAGISTSGGVGLAFAEMAAGRPNPFDFSHFSLERFGKVDPFSTAWLDKCAQARSQKLSG